MNGTDKRLGLPLALLALAGCTPQIVRDAAPGGAVPPTPPIVTIRGLEGVIGADATSLERRFGDARLDVREGPARKLQFAGPVCILDAYLYPPRSGAEPVVTYVDARLADGRDVDRASCVASLMRGR